MQESKLKNCSAYGKEVSRHSPFCRGWGHPQASAAAIWLLALFGVFFLAAYPAFCLYGITLCT